MPTTLQSSNYNSTTTVLKEITEGNTVDTIISSYLPLSTSVDNRLQSLVYNLFERQSWWSHDCSILYLNNTRKSDGSGYYYEGPYKVSLVEKAAHEGNNEFVFIAMSLYVLMRAQQQVKACSSTTIVSYQKSTNNTAKTIQQWLNNELGYGNRPYDWSSERLLWLIKWSQDGIYDSDHDEIHKMIFVNKYTLSNLSYNCRKYNSLRDVVNNIWCTFGCFDDAFQNNDLTAALEIAVYGGYNNNNKKSSPSIWKAAKFLFTKCVWQTSNAVTNGDNTKMHWLRIFFTILVLASVSNNEKLAFVCHYQKKKLSIQQWLNTFGIPRYCCPTQHFERIVSCSSRGIQMWLQKSYYSLQELLQIAYNNNHSCLQYLLQNHTKLRSYLKCTKRRRPVLNAGQEDDYITMCSTMDLDL